MSPRNGKPVRNEYAQASRGHAVIEPIPFEDLVATLAGNDPSFPHVVPQVTGEEDLAFPESGAESDPLADPSLNLKASLIPVEHGRIPVGGRIGQIPSPFQVEERIDAHGQRTFFYSQKVLLEELPVKERPGGVALAKTGAFFPEGTSVPGFNPHRRKGVRLHQLSRIVPARTLVEEKLPVLGFQSLSEERARQGQEEGGSPKRSHELSRMLLSNS